MRAWGNIALRGKALQLLEDANGDSRKEKIENIIQLKGFSYSEFEPVESTRHVLGAVLYDAKEILINSNMPSGERLFTLAHELGHVILHPSKDHMDFRFKKLGQTQNDEESEANLFAYELVMPFTAFTKAYRDHDGDTYSIAEHFSVEEARVSKRLHFLKKQIDSNKINDFTYLEND